MVDAALNAGINFFDTADIYGGTKSETYLGAALGSRRDEIVLATKFGVPYEGHDGGASAAYIRTAVEDSLTRLGTDRIDLYQLHVPDQKTPIAETIGTLVELVAEGKVREFGCSNFTVDMLSEAAAATPDGSPGFVSVQNQYNILYREPEDGVLEWCDRSGVAFLPYFPLASGLLSGKYRAGEPPPEGTRLAAMGDRRGQPAHRRTPGRRGRAGRAGTGCRATPCSTWPSAGCCRVRRSPRSSPAPPAPSRSQPTSPRAPGARRPRCWRPSRPSHRASRPRRGTRPAPGPGGPTGCR